MICPEFEERLLMYDELSAGQRAPVDTHLAECAHCRSFLSALTEVDTALASAFADRQVSPIFADRVLQETRTQRALRRPSIVPEFLDAAGWASIVAILLWLGAFFAPGLEFSLPVAMAIGTMLLMAGFGVAYRCYGDLRRS
jgi:anti-sigma factor RsiW